MQIFVPSTRSYKAFHYTHLHAVHMMLSPPLIHVQRKILFVVRVHVLNVWKDVF
jgi:hypothetical protein